MAALNDRFWAKVLFKEFIRHYRKLTAEQIVADINASMDALEDLDDTGDSFGSKMVRWSMERADEPSAVASRENGKKGGRPRKQPEENPEARESRRTGGDSVKQGQCSIVSPVRSIPMPTTEQLYDFARTEGLDETDAREWWEMTVVDRDGKDRYGKPIANWKAACRKFCAAKTQRRNA